MPHSRIAFSGNTGRQYINLLTGRIRFVAERSRLSVALIARAFGVAVPLRLADAKFDRQVIVGYTTTDEGKKDVHIKHFVIKRGGRGLDIFLIFKMLFLFSTLMGK